MKKDPPQKRLYSIRETAAYLGIGVFTARELIWRGDLPGIRLGRGGRILIDVRDIEDLISANKKRELIR